MQMIVEGGLDLFSLNQLAERLELTPGALYRYFDSRDEILVAVELRIVDDLDRFLREVDRNAADTALDRVVRLIFGYASLAKICPQKFELLGHFVSGPNQVVGDQAAQAVVGPTLGLLGYFSRAMAQVLGAQADTEDKSLRRGALLWSSVQAVFDRQMLGRFSADLFAPEALILDIVRALLVGWGADAAEVDRALGARPSHEHFSNIYEGLR